MVKVKYLAVREQAKQARSFTNAAASDGANERGLFLQDGIN